jgi:hypothetical protein
MPIPEVIGVLREWIPPGDPREATREGLGIALSAAVKERPELFAEEALNFRELDPIYVREYLSGLQEAVKGGARVAWGPVLTLCQWVLEQPRDIPGRVERYSDLDPGWVWTRSGIASLLEVGLTSDASLIPSELRELVWSVIEPLISDPDPEEAADRGGFRDAELSLNSIRGKAMHDVFLYCRWVKLWLDQQGDREHSLEDMPEAERVLRSKLDPAVEGHLAIRAVFGWRYPLLLWLDRSWATEHQDDVFSRQDRGLDALGQSAWNAYLFFARVHLDSLDTLRSQYEVSVETLDSTPRTFPHDDPLIRLSHHLVTFLCTDGLL